MYRMTDMWGNINDKLLSLRGVLMPRQKYAERNSSQFVTRLAGVAVILK